jgi:hypothetical protein
MQFVEVLQAGYDGLGRTRLGRRKPINYRDITTFFLVIVTADVHSGETVSPVPAVPARLRFSGVYGEVVLLHGILREQPPRC